VLRARLFLPAWIAAASASACGCHLLLPETAQEPVIRNPFPQLTRVAVAPFFNQSDESTLDGRESALAYASELQAVQGFEVVPVGVVEEAMIDHQIDLSGPGEARRLAELLEVDAVVVGAVTDYQPYYPPRLGLRVEWYAANPGFHEIPAGYGLPWGTPEEEFIPDNLVYESQLAVARAQVASQTPDCQQDCQLLPAPTLPAAATPSAAASPAEGREAAGGPAGSPTESPSGDFPRAGQGAASGDGRFDPFNESPVVLAQHAEDSLQTAQAVVPARSIAADASETACLDGSCVGDAASLSSPVFPGVRPACRPQHGPVLTHTRIYDGLDHDVTQALKSYAFFQDDERIGGWQSYLRRSGDFVRFCCRLHIAEMLSARGGAEKTRLVWRWSNDR